MNGKPPVFSRRSLTVIFIKEPLILVPSPSASTVLRHSRTWLAMTGSGTDCFYPRNRRRIMARMHSRAKGKSGSTRPSQPTQPAWIPLKSKEIEMLIVKLARDGFSASKIGIALRDEYGVPSVKQITTKRISEILLEKQLRVDIPEDLMALMRRAVLVRKHMSENKKDMTAKRGLQLTESKIRRLAAYYKEIGRIPKSWKYDPETLRLQVE